MAEINTPKGQSYGDRKQFEVNAAAQSGPQGAPSAQGTPEDLMGSLSALPTGRLGGPSTRPDEPVTAGLDLGLGGGASSRPAAAGPPKQDNSVAYLTRYLPAIELIASSENASSGMRQWARRLRAAQPPGGQIFRPEANPRNPV